MTTEPVGDSEVVPPEQLRAYMRRLFWKWIERAAIVGCTAWIGALVVVCPLIHWRAEYNLLTAFLSYLPPLVALVPLGALVPLALLSRQRFFLLPSLLLATGLYLWLYVGYCMGGSQPGSSGDVIKLVTYNFGQNARTSLKPFVTGIGPDIIAIQDAGRRVNNYHKDPFYSVWPHIAQEGEHLLLSRFPIKEHQGVFAPRLDGRQNEPQTQVGSRFVVDWKGRLVSVYSIHFPTPRDILAWYSRRGTFLYAIVGIPGTPFADRRRQYEAYWENRVAQAEALAQYTSQDPHPKLLAGDLNVPCRGAAYGAVRQVFPHDAHLQAGQGFGFTFPGATSNPLGLFKPWLRLDVTMADDNWTVVESTTEIGRRSQHLSVYGSFQWCNRVATK